MAPIKLAASSSLQIDEMGLYKPRAISISDLKPKVAGKFCSPAQKFQKDNF